jgi:hypothetical protein
MNRCLASVEGWGAGCTIVCTQLLEKTGTLLVTYQSSSAMEPTPERW